MSKDHEADFDLTVAMWNLLSWCGARWSVRRRCSPSRRTGFWNDV